MTTIGTNLYIYFKGNASDAIDFYVKAFGGKILYKSTFADAPSGVEESNKNKIMHCSIDIGGSTIMISDDCCGPVTIGDNVQISLSYKEMALLEKHWAGLSEDGKVKMKLEKQFWGATFGSLTDKFGVHWMLSDDQKTQKSLPVCVLPYVYFKDNARQAIDFYVSKLGAKIGKLMTYADGPADSPYGPPDENMKNKVIHSEIEFGNGSMLFICDDPVGHECKVFGDNVHISLSLPLPEMEPLFNGLSEGGKVNVPLAKQFWGSTYGNFVDQFGVNWMMCSNEEKKKEEEKKKIDIETQLYLMFQGNANEAIDYYVKVNAKLEHKQTYGQGPKDMAKEADKDKIMHASLDIGGNTLMISDDSCANTPTIIGDNVQLSAYYDDLSEMEKVWAALTADGKIKLKLEKQFWGSILGCVQDKFGVYWSLGYHEATKEGGDDNSAKAIKSSKVLIRPYFYFRDNAREAIDFYVEKLGGKNSFMWTYGQCPPNTHFSVDAKHNDKIMHCSIDFGNGKSNIMLQDDPEIKECKVFGDNVHVSLSLPLAEMESLFSALSEGGKVKMPLAKQFWGSTFGNFVDKFGINWMMCSNDDHPEAKADAK